MYLTSKTNQILLESITLFVLIWRSMTFLQRVVDIWNKKKKKEKYYFKKKTIQKKLFNINLQDLFTQLIMWRTHRLTVIVASCHARVRGNERANQLAGSADVEEGQARDRADVIGAIREAGGIKDFTDNREPASMSRMKELGWNLGWRKKNDSSRAPDMSSNNKDREILKRGTSMQLSMCLECFDDGP